MNEGQIRDYAAELEELNASLEHRVAERTAALEASRDRLNQFFLIATSLQDTDNIERTLDLVLSLCRSLGYETARLGLVDRPAGLLRPVKTVGALAQEPATTVALNDPGLVATVVREARPAIVPDATHDPRCDGAAAQAAGIRGQIVVPLLCGEVIGTLHVASSVPLYPTLEEMCTLETLASETARALTGLKHMEQARGLNRQLEERNAQLVKLTEELEETAAAERHARDSLWQSQERLRLLLESTGEGIYGINLEGKCTFINRAGAEMLGRRIVDLLGRDMHQMVHHSRPDGSPYPTQECPVSRAFRTGMSCRVESEVFWRADGSAFPVEYASYPIRHNQEVKGAVVTFLDITQRKIAEEELRRRNRLLQETARSEHEAHEALKRAQSQLVQSEKLAALGQMVAGVAHEINNPLSFVSNNLAVLQRDVRAVRDLLQMYRQAESLAAEPRAELHARIQEKAERIDLDYTLNALEDLMARSRDGLKRIQHIVADLRDFARLDESDLHEVDLNAGIESTINIIRHLAKKHEVTLELDLSPLPAIACYPAKINQVVLNLVGNAIAACSAGGKVTVRTNRAGTGVEIHVLDTGTGIAPSIRDKIFDPFFTTKPPGQGTGLGLSISYQIVRDHGGTIEVESTPGQGSHFTVWLPLRPQKACSLD